MKIKQILKKDGYQENSNIIQFIAGSKAHSKVFDAPVPASKIIPKWYKDMNSNLFDSSYMPIDNQTGNPPRTIKSCMPVFDMITAGYMVTLPADVYVGPPIEDGSPNISWSIDSIKPIDFHHPDQFSEYSLSDEYYNMGVKFNNPWIIKTPPGYSTLFIQPSLRDNLPFQVVPAIVDTDKHPSPINFPTFFRKDFQGILEFGTPIIQAIPFKREEWISEVSFYEQSEEYEVVWQKAKRKILNRYKTFYRSPKVWR